MASSNNPAGILLEHMTIALSTPPDQIMLGVWARVFNCDTGSSGEILSGISTLLAVIQEAERAITEFAPGNPEKFLAPLTKIKAFVTSHNLGAQWSTYKRNLDPATMTALEFSDHILSIAYSEDHPGTTKDIRAFILALDELLQECLDSEMSPELKQLFVRNLEALRQALIQYRVGGEEAIRDILDQITGSIVRHQDEIKSEFSKAEELLVKSVGIMGKLEELISKTQNLVALAAPTTTYLLNFFK